MISSVTLFMSSTLPIIFTHKTLSIVKSHNNNRCSLFLIFFCYDSCASAFHTVQTASRSFPSPFTGWASFYRRFYRDNAFATAGWTGGISFWWVRARVFAVSADNNRTLHMDFPFSAAYRTSCICCPVQYSFS